MEPAGMFWIEQLATAALLTVPVQELTVVPFSAKVMVPLGMTGVSAVPVRDAVKVTFVFTEEGLAGDGTTLTVGFSAVVVYGADPGLLTT